MLCVSYRLLTGSQATAGATYLDCFRGTNLRRTEIVMGCWAVQQLCGSGECLLPFIASHGGDRTTLTTLHEAFMNYSTYL